MVRAVANISRASDLELFDRLPDDRAREELVHRYLPLARRLAKRYEGRGEPLEDLVQVASVGLVKAIDRFDPQRGVKFSTYLTATALGELKRHFRDRGWSMRVPRAIKDRVLEVRRARAELAQELGRSPTVGEVARRLDLTDDEVIEAQVARGAYGTLSLDWKPRFADGDGRSLTERIGEPDVNLELVEMWSQIEHHLAELPQRQREILRLRFFEGLTQQEIGDEVGISQMHVSRLLAAALETLREAVDGASAA